MDEVVVSVGVRGGRRRRGEVEGAYCCHGAGGGGLVEVTMGEVGHTELIPSYSQRIFHLVRNIFCFMNRIFSHMLCRD